MAKDSHRIHNNTWTFWTVLYVTSFNPPNNLEAGFFFFPPQGFYTPFKTLNFKTTIKKPLFSCRSKNPQHYLCENVHTYSSIYKVYVLSIVSKCQLMMVTVALGIQLSCLTATTHHDLQKDWCKRLSLQYHVENKGK